MLFDFQSFVSELREKEDKKQIIEKYEKHLWPITWDYKDQERYTQYVSNFNPFPYKVSEEVKEDFDRDFLQQLVISSFSSDYELKQTPDKDWNIEKKWLKDLYIAVKSWEQSIVKTVSELRSFQILRLYEIYIEEQINLHALMYDDEKEKTAIQQEREARLKRRNLIIETMDKEELKEQAKKEQEWQLWDLYSQL